MARIQRGRSRRVVGPVICGLLSLAYVPAAPSLAASPKVAFDVTQTIECQNVTPDAFAKVNPDEKIIELRFQVSALLLEGQQEDIEELIVTLFSPERRLRVVDFSPKTQLVSAIVGEVEQVESTEVERSLTASVGGVLSGGYGIGKLEVTPSAGAGNIRRESSTEKYRRVPSKQPLIVSGTANSEYGVFFKFKPSAQTSLEGTQQFVCRCAVPRDWRGDWALLTCQARRHAKQFFAPSLKRCGYRRVPVALYLAGDPEAKQAATALVRAQAARLAAASAGNKAGTDWPQLVRKSIGGLRPGCTDPAAAEPSPPAAAANCPVGSPVGKPACCAASATQQATPAPRPPADPLAAAFSTLRQLSGGS